MKLEQIRQANNLDELKPAIAFLCDNMQELTFGEFHAYRNTISAKAKELGFTFSQINDIAEHYQIFGEFCSISHACVKGK